jgi:A/G-specific adenine glycosylase
MNFSERVIHWYHQHKRDLPWRNTKDPYKIWLSEIILQQTRVEQGLPYYERFISKYPTIQKLAAAKEQDILKLWQGLGYYSRARNLHFTAKDIVKRYKGKFPDDHSEIRALKGIGDYTAAAIVSFAYNQPYPVLDGNVFRLLSRYFGIDTAINTTSGKKEFNEIAVTLIKSHSTKNYSDFNQAIMEFGARQCKPASPDCPSCPLHASCFAFLHKKVKDLPVKLNKTVVRNRYFNYLVITHNGSLYLKKRTSNDIWKNLYDFPLIESKRKLSPKTFLTESKKLCGNYCFTGPGKTFKHQLSHQQIIATFTEIKLTHKATIPGAIRINASKLDQYPIPRLIEKYLEAK